jgi:D-sedoheptulose 7-phosphate isomerase
MQRTRDYADLLAEHMILFKALRDLQPYATQAAGVITAVLQGGKKVLVCGNGGSAADAQHFAAELVGRFERERRALPAVALSTDPSVVTSLANDYGFDTVFSRQVEALAAPSDVLIAISTSGNSKNVVRAVESAKAMAVHTIGLLGRGGGELARLVDVPVVVPHTVTARIQEAHTFLIHYWAAVVEDGAHSSTPGRLCSREAPKC